MLSKNEIKLINSLSQKKYREVHQLFIVEGKKSILEFLDSHMELHHLYSTSDDFDVKKNKHSLITEQELKKASSLKTPNTCIALFRIPKSKTIDFSKLVLALDDVRDPGNLGTIIRLCDWFGVEHLVCSKATVDCYNPKVVQATMGSLARVSVHYTDLAAFLGSSNVPIFGAFMDGANIYSHILPKQGILVMGNEANGISQEVASSIKKRVGIPQFGDAKSAESLNVATATAIMLSEFARRSIGT